MTIFTKTKDLIEFRKKQNLIGIGFVPTMGALHQGHLELVKRSVSENDFTYVSIFVNPLQFNDKNDFENYPKNIEEDIKLLSQLGTDALFLPDFDEIYSNGILPDEINLTYLNSVLEGPKRPGHFEGVVKVVSILFKIIQAHKAYFGLKDFQQVKVIQELVRQKNYTIQLVDVPTVREADGLAMSSRNTRLSKEGRQLASQLYRWLCMAKEMYQQNKSIEEIKQQITSEIKKDKRFVLDYFDIRDADSLVEITHKKQKAVALIAAYLEDVRLIDNLLLT